MSCKDGESSGKRVIRLRTGEGVITFSAPGETERSAEASKIICCPRNFMNWWRDLDKFLTSDTLLVEFYSVQ